MDNDAKTDAFLAHYGVPGMKWGRRRQRRLDTLNRVADGNGSKLDKVKVALREVSALDRERAGSYKGAVKNQAAIMENRKKRALEGKAIAGDILNDFGMVGLSNLGSKYAVTVETNPTKRTLRDKVVDR